MKLSILLLFGILFTLVSCNGQNSNKDNTANLNTIGETVYELGSNIMVIYQDKNNIYWLRDALLTAAARRALNTL